jgi:hypothetical protein
MSTTGVDDPLSVAVRAWTTPQRAKPGGRARLVPIKHWLVFDTETTTDAAQALLFGTARYLRLDESPEARWVTVTEILFHADDLEDSDRSGYAVLRDYAATHRADVDMRTTLAEPEPRLLLISRDESVRKWLVHLTYRRVKPLGAAGVGLFNAPFDLSRMAVDVEESRERRHTPAGQELSRWDGYYGGFTFTLLADESGEEAGFTPRIRVKTIDNKRALKGYSRTEPGRRDHFRGHFLDLRTAAFALTGTGHTLRSAGDAFNRSARKSDADGPGAITPDYIDYARNDTAATAALLEKVLDDFDRHAIELMPTRAFSPATIAKAYLDAMGITPLMQRRPDVPDWVHAAAMEAFYGGRAECRIRKTPLPVALVDFTSMYATVDTLMGLFDLLTAEHVEVDTEAAAEVQQLLDTITEDGCFEQARWRDFVGLVQFQPHGQVLPVRADYQPRLTGTQDHEQDETLAGVSCGIGVNPLTATQPLWYTIPDAIAATLHAGQAPQILQAIRL